MSILSGTKLLEVIDNVAKAKDFKSNVILEALEQGMQEAYKKKYGLDKNIEVVIDKKTGDMKAFWVKEIVDSPSDANQIDVFKAKQIDSNLSIGELIKETLPNLDLSISTTDSVRKVLLKKIQSVEKLREYEAFKSRVGDIIFGVIKSIDYHGNCIVNLSGIGEGFISSRDLLKSDTYKVSDRIRAYIYKVNQEEFKHQIHLSRTHNGMLSKLLELEIPHIYDNIITIEAIARDPGFRSKVAVSSKDDTIDPVSACIGPKGVRIKQIMEELSGEKIDIVLWDQNLKQFISNAFRSDKIYNIIVHKDINVAEIVAGADAISLIIGRQGQNARLISNLTKTQIKILSKELYQEKKEKEFAHSVNLLSSALNIELKHAKILVENGFHGLKDVRDNKAEIMQIHELKEEVPNFIKIIDKGLEKIKTKYRHFATQYWIDFAVLEVLDQFLHWDDIEALVQYGVKSIEDLASLSVEELLSCISDKEFDKIKIKKLIAEARQIYGQENKEEKDIEDETSAENSQGKEDSNTIFTREQIDQKIEEIKESVSVEQETVPVLEATQDVNEVKEEEKQEIIQPSIESEVLHSIDESQNLNDLDMPKEEYKPSPKKVSPSISRSIEYVEKNRPKAHKKGKSRIEIEQPKSGAKIYREITLSRPMSVEEVAHAMSEKSSDVLKELMKMGLTVTLNSILDIDSIEILALSLGHSVKKVQTSNIDQIFNSIINDKGEASLRPPVIAIMGHVNHGKTTLLKAFTSKDISESGDITQRIVSYQIPANNNKFITILDTPGHSAFTRAREIGTLCVDIVVIIIAADDGISVQTIECIKQAQEAQLPIIVAINKIDNCPEKNISQVKHELLKYSLVSEELGGTTMVIQISARNGTNIDKLKDAILMEGEILDLKANFEGNACGLILDSFIDKEKGILTTILVQQGKLCTGDIILSEQGFNKTKVIYNQDGEQIKHATPSMIVNVAGIGNIIGGNPKFVVTQDEKQAKYLLDNQLKFGGQQAQNIISFSKEKNISDIFTQKETKQLNIILKVEFYGTIKAITDTLISYADISNIKINIIAASVGHISDSDLSVAASSHARIFAFNVKVNSSILKKAQKQNIEIKSYTLVHKLFEDVQAILNSMLSPIIEEHLIGSAKILKIFDVSKIGQVLGCSVISGTIKRNAKVKILRRKKVVAESKVRDLKIEKDSVKEVKKGAECGIALVNQEFLMQVDDELEFFDQISKEQKIF
jgi:translation initiation factor IF-2